MPNLRFNLEITKRYDCRLTRQRDNERPALIHREVQPCLSESSLNGRYRKLHRDARNRHGISAMLSTKGRGFLCCECAIKGMRRGSPATRFRARQGAERQRHRLLFVKVGGIPLAPANPKGAFHFPIFRKSLNICSVMHFRIRRVLYMAKNR